MTDQNLIRVLVVDDERLIREAYCEILADRPDAKPSELDRLRAGLFGRENRQEGSEPAFEIHLADSAEAAVAAVRDQFEQEKRFDVAFLDMRMPPGPDGAWTAVEIRTIDPNLDIVIVTAYSDVDPRDLSARIPPAGKLFYLQKPFHAHEVRQVAAALGGKARAEAHIRRLAYFDSLTGLANRQQVRDQLSSAISVASLSAQSLAVLFIDLDNFKRINDTLGHSVGDDILKATAQRLRETIRGADMVTYASEIARMGGDEFVLILRAMTQPEDAAIVAERITSALAAPMEARGHNLYVTPSIGISIYPKDGDDIETLFRNADLAMYFAKSLGRNKIQYYDASMNEAALKSLTIESQLRGAIDRGELSLHYQPQVELKTGRVCGMEALLRWRNEVLGDVPPLEFIGVAEESGLIDPIGDWVLHAACEQASAWRDADIPLEKIAVNVSAVQLSQPDFVDRVMNALEISGLDPNVLELELTETALVANIDQARAVLDRLKALNVGIAIDDFGLGYSNMAQLRTLSIDRVKIDRSFVMDIQTDDRGRAVASAIISMAQGMKMRVTAEGVEDGNQIAILEAQQCDEVQGYFISRPMGVVQAEAFLRASMEGAQKA